jgi:osmoprotectant transport system substrate-binding protein
MKGRSRTLIAGMLVAAAVAVSGCGLNTNTGVPFTVTPGTITPVPALQGVNITVGSKDFTEQILLGYMAELALSAAGANITDLTNIQGSSNSRLALRTGDIDLTWEYTGTGWINYLNNTDPIPDEQKQYEAVRDADLQQNGLVWLPYSPLNNTYAFGTTRAYAEQHNLRTNSDMTRFLTENPAEAVFCVETEFASRQDGLPGVQALYGFPTTEVKSFGTGAIYSSIANGTCNFGEIFTTDGRVQSLGLTPFDDDKKFFPNYNPALNVRADVYNKYPAIQKVIEPVFQKLDNPTMTALNAKVSAEGEEPKAVAEEWLKQNGFIK